MSSQIVDVANAVVASLNAATLSQEFTAVRKWIPKSSLEDLSELTVTVVPKDYARVNETRVDTRRNIQIDVGIQKHIETTTDPEHSLKLEELDELMQFVEEVADHFGPAKYGGAAWVSSEIPEPMYDRESLDSQRVFTSVVTLTFTRT